ncbi:MAG TPA: hypothetical protein PL141_11795 [Thermoflexales bacterium]|nr:hypothetical protein [Thermoflexales bacterium]HQW35508.1 hypothetical protein [Thermoflexales bacterium]
MAVKVVADEDEADVVFFAELDQPDGLFDGAIGAVKAVEDQRVEL